MSRIAIIGHNSIQFIELLLKIWNNSDCAVLIDWQIPIQTAIEMMLTANVEKCYIDNNICIQEMEVFKHCSIEFISFNSSSNITTICPDYIRQMFFSRYDKNEAVIIYSSGTTGNAKGIILTHFAINTNADAIIDYMNLEKGERLFIAKPFSHSSTLTGELLVALKANIDLIIAPTTVPPRYSLEKICMLKSSIVCINPTLLQMYCEEYRRNRYDLSFLKTIYVSGSILNDRIYELSHKLFPNISIYNVYGLSEAGPRVTAQTVNCCKTNSVGQAIKGVDVILVNDCGECVPINEIGIIHVKTPSSFLGYVSNNLEIKKSIIRGWINTGDLGYFDNNNELHIVGRSDNMIIVNTHKIYPSEIEKQIMKFSNVYDCIVTSAMIEENDTLCCLYVSNKKIREDIKKILGTRLPKYEIPKLFFQIEEIPKTQNGKISIKGVRNLIKVFERGGSLGQ